MINTQMESIEGFCPQQFLLDEISRVFPNRVESPLNTYIRAEQVKNFLRDYVNSTFYKGGKIVLVGHQTIFKFMTGTEWETVPVEETLRMGKISFKPNFNKDPLNYKRMNNCEFYPLDSHLF